MTTGLTEAVESVTVREQMAAGPFQWTRTHALGVVAISFIYFADIFLKASHKCYWYDELFTVYLCRLPRFADTWRAVLHGCDFNPPLFYLATRWAQALFGHGLIATRLPSILGVWLFGLCLFLFASRRIGVFGGLIAGVFPFFTFAQYYAYEARAHGTVLGFCGLALLCWQRNGEGGRAKYWWLAGFGLSFAGALLTHVYGIYWLVPFALVELHGLLRRERINWGILGAILCTAAPIVLLVYLPLLRSYRATIPAGFMLPNHHVLQSFLVDMYGPALGVLLLALALLAVEGRWPGGEKIAAAGFPRRELLLAATLALVPLLGFLGARISHGPFVDRYFLPSVGGIAIILAGAMCRRSPDSRGSRALAGCLVLFMLGDLGITAYLVMGGHNILLVEPSSKLVVSTKPSDPMEMYQTVARDPGGLDILVLPSLDYFYFVEYAPRSVVSRLYFASGGDVGLGLYQKLAKWVHTDFQTTSFSTFLAVHDQFLVYDTKDHGDLEAMQAIAGRGYHLVSAQGDTGGILYEFAR
jgi:hypothetical protein